MKRTRTEMALLALRAARRGLRRERRFILESNCLLDPRGRPIVDTLDDLAKPHVQKLDLLLRGIDRALAEWAL